MARSEFMSIAIVAIVLAVSFKHAYALKCWQCSWSGVGTNSEFCKNPLELNTTEHWAYQDCPAAKDLNTYCRKIIDTVNNSTIITRGCYQRPKNATEETCSDKSPTAVKTEECVLCSEDGCNGKNIAGQFTSTIAFIATSTMIAYILSA